MLGLQVLDIAVGLIFVYLLLSIICTAINELIAGWLRLRAKNLAAGIENLLRDNKITNLKAEFYKHPLIKSLSKKGEHPSYMPPRTFTLAFLDTLVPAKSNTPVTIAEIRKKMESLDADSDIRRILLIYLEEVQGDVEKLKNSIETWFNNTMDRVSGWYKRKTQVIIIILAVVAAALASADTIEIAKALSIDPLLRQAVVAQAQEFARQQERSEMASENTVPPAKAVTAEGEKKQSTSKSISTQAVVNATKQESPSEKIKTSINQLQNLGIPLGWKKQPEGTAWVNKIIGLLLTAVAVSLGAPFWFNILQKVAKIRAAGVVPTTESKKSKSKENKEK